MNASRAMFLCVVALAAAMITAAGCGGGGSGPAPVAIVSPPLPTPTPAPNKLYVDHNGTLFEYALPLKSGSKPVRQLQEAPGSGFAPQLAVAPYGSVAIVTSTTVRVFKPPIVSFEPSKAHVSIRLTPAITQVGQAGAVLTDAEYDPNGNLWLVNILGEVSELAAPLSRSTTNAAVIVLFGSPGTKTSGFTPIHASFDVNATLYVFAAPGAGIESAHLFKTSFPYAKPPSGTGLNLDFADFVDSSQYLPTNPNPAPLILGQYNGSLKSPPPGQPPPPPVDRLAQFAEPLNPVQGLFPNATANAIVGAIAADAPRELFYALDQATGRLDVYPLPLRPSAKPGLSFACIGGSNLCSNKPEHLFLAP